jgi:HPt (histidine-containing phosphotransfer) domain-containing protein
MLDRIQQRDVTLQEAHDGLEKRVAQRTAFLNALIEQGGTPCAPRHSFENVCHLSIDLETTFERLDGDRSLFQELGQVFRGYCPRIVERMRRAIVMQDAKSLEDCAHTLKGSSANLGALAVSHAAAEIERLAHTGSVGSTSVEFGLLQEELERVFSELESLSTQ